MLFLSFIVQVKVTGKFLLCRRDNQKLDSSEDEILEECKNSMRISQSKNASDETIRIERRKFNTSNIGT